MHGVHVTGVQLSAPRFMNKKMNKKEEIFPLEAMEHAQDATSPEALSRLRAEKEKQIDYYYFDGRTGKLFETPPTVNRVDLNYRHAGEYLVKVQNGSVLEIRSFKDEESINPEARTNLIERIEKALKGQLRKE